MKKTLNLIDLDCANCAAKMERNILKINGVRSATVSFFAQKLVLEADDDLWDTVLSEVAKAIRKVDSNCRLDV